MFLFVNTLNMFENRYLFEKFFLARVVLFMEHPVMDDYWSYGL